MTIQFKYPWNGLDGIQTLAPAEETRLVGLGVARVYTPGMDGVSSVPVTASKLPGAGVALDAGGQRSYLGTSFTRWCIPGKDTSGTLFKDVSGKGNDATIDASNTTPFAVDNRISTIVHASAGGVTLPLAAGLCDFRTDSWLMAWSMTNADPAASVAQVSWGGTAGNVPGFYFSHRVGGFGRAVANIGNGTIVSGSDSTVKFSNAGGTRETHALMAFDAQTGSLYLMRDGVVAVVNTGLLTGANALVSGVPAFGPRLGGQASTAASNAGVFRGWQGYVFAGRGLPLNIGRIAAMLAESPSTPLRDDEFTFAA